MARGRKPSAEVKTPAVASEPVKKTPKSRSKSASSRSATRKRKPSTARSKSRSRKPQQSASRGRSRSRSRSRSKSKSKDVSPKRKGKERGRSQTRAQKTSSRAASRSRGRSRSRPKKVIPNTDILNDLVDIVEQKKASLEALRDDFTAKESKLNEIIRRSISRELSQEKTNTYRFQPHTSVLKSLKEVESKDVDGKSKEISVSLPKKKLSFSFSVPESFKAILGLTIPPLVVLILHLACNRNQCTISKFHVPRNWKYYLNLESLGIVAGFVTFQALLSLLPIGKKVDGPLGVNGALQYRCNGLLSTLISIGIVGALWHYKFPVTIVYDKLISLLVSSTILAYLFGWLLFLKGGRAPVPGLNPGSIVGSRLHQFFVGREINPIVFKKINVKTLLVRTCLIGMLLLNGLLVLKAYEAKHEITHALGTCLALTSLLVLDFFWFENSFPQTFEAMYEGTGCNLTLSYFLYPFLTTLVTKYIVQHKIELPVWGSVAIIIGFCIGFVIYRGSNSQKASFRKSPLNTAPTQMEAISTNRGKKLLVAGWWGWVRHPNYLGSIILHWAWASNSGYTHAIPYLVPLIVTALLVLRAKRVDSFCNQRYQSAWDEYCSRVRYRIFPRIY